MSSSSSSARVPGAGIASFHSAAPTLALSPQARLLQRKCACGAQSHGNAECSDCAKKRNTLQRKLTLGASNDPLEMEADQVADKVLAKSAHSGISNSPLHIQRFAGHPADQANSVPASVDRALAGAGRSLEPALREDMEHRFGYDFSSVRVHSGEAAERSARDVAANAFTVGSHIVFGAGQLTPETHAGKRLLAHELTHVVQQTGPAPLDARAGRGPTTSPPSHGAQQVQRFVACEQASLSLEPCPPREKNEIAESHSDAMTVHDYAELSDEGDTINSHAVVGFAIDDSSLKSNLKASPKWKELVNYMAKSNMQWNIHGVSDCSGTKDLNANLRKARARAIYAALPEAARANVVLVDAAPLTDCIAGNQRKIDRTVNRAVVIEQAGRSVDIDPTKEKPIKGAPPKFACGPDVTTQVASAVGLARSLFAGWTKDQREDACDALVNVRVGYCAWDIRQLHNNRWISHDYQPKHCATTGAGKGQECGESVQVGTECYYAGSANYVIYGTMFNLCAHENPDGHFDFNKSNMKSLIDLYKGSGVSGMATPSPDFKPSLAWANAGYDGWPSGGSPPSGDRSNCAPMCPAPYTGVPFDVHWYPHSPKKEGCSPSINKAVRKGAN